MQIDTEKVLEGLGVKAGSFDRIRLARGVVGKTSYVAVAAMFVLGVVAFRAASLGLLASVAGATAILFLIYLGGILWFATKNPGLALLEGAELIQWRQMEMGKQGGGVLLESPNITPPNEIEGPH